MKWLVIWLIVAAVMVVLEMISMGLTSIWFAGGAVCAAILSLTDCHWIIQAIVFGVVSVVLLFTTRPIAQKHLMKTPEKTNLDSLIGKKVLVLEEINNIKASGVVILNGVEWTARSKSDDVIIQKDKTVVIEAIDGVKLIVSE